MRIPGEKLFGASRRVAGSTFAFMNGRKSDSGFSSSIFGSGAGGSSVFAGGGAGSAAGRHWRRHRDP